MLAFLTRHWGSKMGGERGERGGCCVGEKALCRFSTTERDRSRLELLSWHCLASPSTTHWLQALADSTASVTSHFQSRTPSRPQHPPPPHPPHMWWARGFFAGMHSFQLGGLKSCFFGMLYIHIKSVMLFGFPPFISTRWKALRKQWPLVVQLNGVGLQAEPTVCVFLADLIDL